MFNSPSLFKYKMSGSQTFILAFLVVVLVGLSERILYDLSRTIVGPTYSYINDLATLLLHAVFVVVIIVVAVVVNIAAAEKKEKYAVVLIPYFITAIALALQLAIEAAIYFTNHHTPAEFYLVMTSLVVISSVLIYYIQKRYIPPEPSDTVGIVSSMSWPRIVGGVIVLLFILFLVGGYFLRFFWGGFW